MKSHHARLNELFRAGKEAKGDSSIFEFVMLIDAYTVQECDANELMKDILPGSKNILTD